MFGKKNKNNEKSIIITKNRMYDLSDIATSKTVTTLSEAFVMRSKTSNFIFCSSNKENIKNNVFIPNILKQISNYIVIDDDDYILKRTAKKMKENGYNVVVFNLNDTINTRFFNPIKFLADEEKKTIYFTELATILLKRNTNNFSDPFWTHTERNFLTLLLYYSSMFNKYSFESIMKAASELEEHCPTITDETFLNLYKSHELCSYKIKTSVISSVINHLIEHKNIFNYFEDDFNPNDLIDKKTIIYFNFVDKDNLLIVNSFIHYISYFLYGRRDYELIQFMYNNDIVQNIVENAIFNFGLKAMIQYNCIDTEKITQSIKLYYNFVLYDNNKKYITNFFDGAPLESTLLKFYNSKKENEALFFLNYPMLTIKKDKLNNFSFKEEPFIIEQKTIDRTLLQQKALSYLYATSFDYNDKKKMYVFKRNATSKIEVYKTYENIETNKIILISEEKYNTTEDLFTKYPEYLNYIEEIKYI